MTTLKGSYRIIRPLGSGTFAKVKLGEHLITNQKVAVKIIKRSLISEQHLYIKIQREIKILKILHHPHIIKLYDVIYTEKEIILILEYVSGGELYTLIEKGRLQENEARKYFQQIISAISYCHQRRVTHRDIKPENLFLDEDSNIKIGDFGLSNIIRDGVFFKTACGSPNYAAPEVIAGCRYCGPEADVWSIGVVLYALLAGYLPFDENSISSLFSKIKNAKFDMPHHFSRQVKDLIKRMITADPVSRITIMQIKEHPWYKTDLPLHLSITDLNLDAIDNTDLLSIYRAYRYHSEIDEEILNNCLKYAELQDYANDKENIKKNIIRRKYDPFSVTYEILLNTKLREKRIGLDKSNIELKPTFKNSRSFMISEGIENMENFIYLGESNPTNDAISEPHNWSYCIRTKRESYTLMCLLFNYFRECQLEWKLISNFNIRARSVGYQVLIDRLADQKPISPIMYGKIIKFDIVIYKYGDSFALDCLQIEGQTMVFLDTVIYLNNKLNNLVD
ncbi:SNF1-like_5 [Blepharisma stoltei]|uniref:Protein kinase domain-containing protein n=1 Tax=Blepharisma stoltei TaxID=1481888 RepID=A0AAU9IZT0_9CILI|nr:unnamed protein product [Blepharisma stoltei]